MTPTRRLRLSIALLILTLLVVSNLAGCAGPGYYAQAVAGHWRLMQARQPIDRYLAEAEPDDPWVEDLVAAQAMLAFAEERLGLPADGSYDRFVPMEQDAITWNVVATPPYSLDPERWCFPVAGCVPYRGYFERENADQFAARLRDQGMDVAVSGATAYSTLGWFEDPLLGTMLRGSRERLAETLFHELAHQLLYVAGDTEFNESYATFVGQQGVRAWLQDRAASDALIDWEAQQAAVDAFLALLRDARDGLARRYAEGGDEDALARAKAEHFATLRADYDALVERRWDGQDRFGGWFEPPPNNADLALVGSYTDGLCAFESLWREAGGDFARFHALARGVSERPAAARTDWLARRCPEDGLKIRGATR